MIPSRAGVGAVPENVAVCRPWDVFATSKRTSGRGCGYVPKPQFFRLEAEEELAGVRSEAETSLRLLPAPKAKAGLYRVGRRIQANAGEARGVAGPLAQEASPFGRS